MSCLRELWDEDAVVRGERGERGDGMSGEAMG